MNWILRPSAVNSFTLHMADPDTCKLPFTTDSKPIALK